MFLMVFAFSMPFMGLTAVGTLSRIASLLGTGATLFENWKLKKLQELGISQDLLHPIFTEEEEEIREWVRGMRIAKGESTVLDDEFRILVIDFEHEDEEIAGRYAFVSKDEFHAFCDSVRHHNLSMGFGPEVDRLEEILRPKGINIHDLSFLWSDFEPVFKKAKKLSARRLADRDFRKMAGLS